MTHKTGYWVYLFGEKFWHRTLNGARKRSQEAENYCQGEHNQIIKVETGDQVGQSTRKEIKK